MKRRSLYLDFTTILLTALTLSACASSPYMLPESDTANRAPGAAFTSDGMHFRKEMPNRTPDRPWEFYYKTCNETGREGYMSKTDYGCNEPF